MSEQSPHSPISVAELTSRNAVVVVWLYFLAMALLGIWTLDGVQFPLPTVLGIVLYAALCFLVSRDRSPVVPVRLVWLAIGVGVLNTALVSAQLTYVGYTQWFFGVATLSMFYVGLRGRVAMSWIGFSMVSSVVLLWGLVTPFGLTTGVVVVAKQAPVLIVGSLVALGMRRAGEQVQRLNEAASARAIAEQRQLATIKVREDRMRSLATAVSPMLEKLAAGTALTATDRATFALTEAWLRDSVRAKLLDTSDVRAAVRAARQRGVEVVLLDDSGEHHYDPNELEGLRRRIISAVNAAVDGCVTARLLPAGRNAIGTIVSDGSEHSMETVTSAH